MKTKMIFTGEELLKIGNKKLNKNQIFRKQRYRGWLKNPHCYWCGVEMIYIDNIQEFEKTPEYLILRDKMVTIDHLYSRLEPEKRHSKESKTVLACWKCNNKRGKEDEAKFLTLQEKQERSKRFPQSK